MSTGDPRDNPFFHGPHPSPAARTMLPPELPREKWEFDASVRGELGPDVQTDANTQMMMVMYGILKEVSAIRELLERIVEQNTDDGK